MALLREGIAVVGVGLHRVFILFFLSPVLFAAPPSPESPLATAAEYYFSRQDYTQALGLWSEVLRRQPDSVEAVLRVAELKLLSQGRQAASQTILGFMEAKGTSLSAENRQRVAQRLGELQSTFLTDEAQAVFFRALPKIRAKAYSAAMTLLNQAVALEPANLQILREKMHCEKAMGLFDRYYETLKIAYEVDPYDPEIRENMLEALVYNGEMAKAIAIVRKETDSVLNLRERTAYGVALSESGAELEAAPVLQGLAEEEKLVGVAPIVLYELGKQFSSKADGSTEASYYLDRFLNTVSRPENTFVDGWDPYHCQDRIEPAKKQLALERAKTHVN